MIATLNRLAVHAEVETLGLCTLPPALAPLRIRVIGSFRLSNDPALDCTRQVAVNTALDRQRAAETA